MRFLVDEHISYKFAKWLNDKEGVSAYSLTFLGLQSLNDKSIFDYSISNNLCIITKDSDFHDLHLKFGSPPKIIISRNGNTSTSSLTIKFEKILNDLISFLEYEDIVEVF